MTRVVLAYGGGLAESIAIPWLAERYGHIGVLATPHPSESITLKAAAPGPENASEQ